MSSEISGIFGPAIHAIDACVPGIPANRARRQLLSDDQRSQLARVASIVRFEKGEEIYSEGDGAVAAFNIVTGVAMAYRAIAQGEYVTSFLYPGDIFGLPEQGHYANSTKAVTPVVAYRIPLPALCRMLDTNAGLDVDIIIKLCESLREAQRHALLLVQRRAAIKLAMFLELQEGLQMANGEAASEIYLPMDRTSIAAYLGLTLAGLSRAFRTLISKRVISCRNRHHVKILDKEAFSRLTTV
jgi:CRP-like cAMP-binding protein